jgi:hypothetical protein
MKADLEGLRLSVKKMKDRNNKLEEERKKLEQPPAAQISIVSPTARRVRNYQKDVLYAKPLVAEWSATVPTIES